MSWWTDLAPICRTDVPLGEFTWYKLGGPARWMFAPRSEHELARLIARLRDVGVRWNVLGRGANLLVSDEGFDGAVIRLSEPAFANVQFDGARVTAGAGCDFPKLIRRCITQRLGGLEGLAGIPGTLGGVVRMNAGGKYGEIGPLVREARVVTAEGRVETRPAATIEFRYRSTRLHDCVLVSATLALAESDPAALLERHQRIWREKHATQPPVAHRSAGCIFKNPPGHKAGKLLDEAGLKGVRAGGAMISERHANFIVADPSATAADVFRLIDLARERVLASAGVELQTEVQIW